MTDAKPLLAFLLESEFHDKYPHQLVARFPHVARKLEAIWNNPEAAADYFTELMIPSRPNRQGFPPDVAAEIISLSMAFDRIGHLVAAEEVSAPEPPAAFYQWDRERLVKEIESQGFAFNRDGFAKAAEAGNHEVCAMFVRAGFDVDTRDAREWTPLMIAAFHGREQLALMLLEFGADVFATDRGGYSPLHWAAFSGYQVVVKLLLERGVSANVLSNAGISPLLQAAARGHEAVVGLLLESQANPNLTARDGASPLLKAVANGHAEVAERLLNAGAYRHVTLADGTTLDDIVAKAKDWRIRAIFC
ncbi:ankyrin repeat domain-containing protein [Dechloromonas sp. XY25]|uniref:Ankyrin repeat domain-containing protein n=1 Tax=Dechloromonas hankyongensis TaxID=2908002 RepID=A0ABS9K037_9RHOO|nr:ankyrin repeat domain-containing protein [Dechloromonas hankyongensis]MCG2576523.1 ankyrin repeat domain-containing protein [Dechloromonas hankyongensis]